MAKSIKQKDINLLLAMSQGTVKKKSGVSKVFIIIIVILFALIIAALAFMLHYEVTMLEDEKMTLENYINDPSIVASYDEAMRTQSEAGAMIVQSDHLKEILLGISSFPQITSDGYREIYSIASSRVEISGLVYDATTGVLNFNAQSDTASGVPIFIAQLRYSELFADIQYAGYASQSISVPGATTIDQTTGEVTTTTVESTAYAFAVSCLVNAPEPSLPSALQDASDAEAPAEDMEEETEEESGE